MRPSIYFSLIVKSRSNPFLESTSIKQLGLKFLAQGNNRGPLMGLEPRLTRIIVTVLYDFVC